MTKPSTHSQQPTTDNDTDTGQLTNETSEIEQQMKQIVAEENARIDNGDYKCPECDFEVGLINTASCNQCGHVPTEVRA